MNPIREDLVTVRCITIMVFCLFLSSCTKQQPLQQKSNNDQLLIDNQKILDLIIQQEAMLIDIPIPLYDHRIIPSDFSSFTSDTLVFGYKSPLSRAQARDFFMNQMERYGWQHLVTFDTSESLLQFASPDRFCTVIIKNDPQDSLHSSIFIYIKKASTEARL
jgi:hypothetical protein